MEVETARAPEIAGWGSAFACGPFPMLSTAIVIDTFATRNRANGSKKRRFSDLEERQTQPLPPRPEIVQKKVKEEVAQKPPPGNDLGFSFGAKKPTIIAGFNRFQTGFATGAERQAQQSVRQNMLATGYRR